MAIAVITGASAGIGRELAMECARNGYDLAVVARRKEPLEQLAETVRSLTGRTVRPMVHDLASAAAPGEIFGALDQGADVEILINNAGVGMRGPFHELDAARQVEMLELNIVALTRLTRLFLPGMVARKKGRVLNVASTAAFQPGPLMAVYYASKAYVLSFSEALYNELAPSGVTVTVLCPGPTRTEFAQAADMERTKLFQSPGVMDAAAVARIGFRAMMAGKPLVIPGPMNRLMAYSTRLVSLQMAAGIARRLQE
jgi:uncharacterized protein